VGEQIPNEEQIGQCLDQFYYNMLLKLLELIPELLTNSDLQKAKELTEYIKANLASLSNNRDSPELSFKLKQIEDKLQELPANLPQTFGTPTDKIPVTVIFRHGLPGIQQPNCRQEFGTLIQTAHDAYIGLSAYPNCHHNIPSTQLPTEFRSFDIVIDNAIPQLNTYNLVHGNLNQNNIEGKLNNPEIWSLLMNQQFHNKKPGYPSGSPVDINNLSQILHGKLNNYDHKRNPNNNPCYVEFPQPYKNGKIFNNGNIPPPYNIQDQGRGYLNPWVPLQHQPHGFYQHGFNVPLSHLENLLDSPNSPKVNFNNQPQNDQHTLPHYDIQHEVTNVVNPYHSSVNQDRNLGHKSDFYPVNFNSFKSSARGNDKRPSSYENAQSQANLAPQPSKTKCWQRHKYNKELNSPASTSPSKPSVTPRFGNLQPVGDVKQPSNKKVANKWHQRGFFHLKNSVNYDSVKPVVNPIDNQSSQRNDYKALPYKAEPQSRGALWAQRHKAYFGSPKYSIPINPYVTQKNPTQPQRNGQHSYAAVSQSLQTTPYLPYGNQNQNWLQQYQTYFYPKTSLSVKQYVASNIPQINHYQYPSTLYNRPQYNPQGLHQSVFSSYYYYPGTRYLFFKSNVGNPYMHHQINSQNPLTPYQITQPRGWYSGFNSHTNYPNNPYSINPYIKPRIQTNYQNPTAVHLLSGNIGSDALTTSLSNFGDKKTTNKSPGYVQKLQETQHAEQNGDDKQNLFKVTYIAPLQPNGGTNSLLATYKAAPLSKYETYGQINNYNIPTGYDAVNSYNNQYTFNDIASQKKLANPNQYIDTNWNNAANNGLSFDWQRWLSIANSDKLKTSNDKEGLVELTYLLKRPVPLVYHPVYYVKFRTPYSVFANKYRQMLQRQYKQPKHFHQELLRESNITIMSPDLKNYKKADISKLLFDNGALINFKVVNSTNIKDQVRDIQKLSVPELDDALKITKVSLNSLKANKKPYIHPGFYLKKQWASYPNIGYKASYYPLYGTWTPYSQTPLKTHNTISYNPAKSSQKINRYTI
jgi:hypothetical protein